VSGPKGQSPKGQSPEGPLLDARGLIGGYGGMDILNGVDIAVDSGEIVVIVGPNGAGKSTAMKAIAGLVPLKSGRITYAGQEITGEAPEHLAAHGIAYVPQERNVFRTLTVEENLAMGGYRRRGDLAREIARIYQLFPALKDRRRQCAGELSGGQRQMVAIGRALMIEPRLLLLDEPTVGLSPKVIGEIFERIRAINAGGVGILMVEQNARAALAIAHRGYVLATGRNRFADSAAALLANRDVAQAFLGGDGGGGGGVHA
jgi:branched-chain amino acid transport system ATP-binding protein